VKHFQENVRQPAQHHPPQAEPLPVAVRGKMSIQPGSNVHALLLGYQNGNVIHPLTCDSEYLGYAESLPQFSEFVQKMNKP
jgi:hypothetical protein